jgi:O-antigen ligase
MPVTAISKNIHSQEFTVHCLAALLGLCLLAILVKIGLLGVLAASLLLLVIIVTPLLMNRYSLFLFLWLFMVPAFDNMRDFLVAGTNPLVFLITGITLPFAMILIGRDFTKVSKDLPFISTLLGFNLILTANLLRPDAEPGVLLECLKLFFEIFIIFCAYREIKAGQADRLFRQVNWFILFNSGIAFFQRLTGIGLAVIEGVPRVGGLVGHPNCLAFLNVLYLPFGIYQLLQAKTPSQRNFWLMGVITATAALLLTLCKNVILTMVLQYLILFLFLPKQSKIRCVSIVLAFVGITLSANFIFNLGLMNLILERFANNDSMEWRLKIWGYLLNNIDLSSLFTGHGVNAGKAVIRMAGTTETNFIHNIYLQLLYEYGLTGLLFLFAFLQPSLKFISAFFQAKTMQVRLNRVFPLLILMAIFINMATDNSVFLRTPMCFAWVFITYFYLQSDINPVPTPAGKLKTPSLKKTRSTTALVQRKPV